MSTPADPIPSIGSAPSIPQAAGAFRRIQGRILATLVRQTIRSARLRLSLVVGLGLLLWTGLFFIVYEGFAFLDTAVPSSIYEKVVHAVFSTFFLTLLLMLLFSAALILYASLFRSRETAWLLTLPVRDEQVFLHKFQEAAVLSGWGFLLLGSPMLLAYGLVAKAPWYYYAMLLPMMVAFVHIPVGLAAMLCLEVMDRAPRKRGYVVAAALGLVLVAAIWFFWILVSRPESNLLTTRWFLKMLVRLELTEQRLLPSWWLSSGLLETAAGAWSEGILFLVLLVANALFCRQLAIWAAARVYRRAFCRVSGVGTPRRRPLLVHVDRWLDRLLGFVPRQVRLLLVKDLRLFRRDPVQWSQFLILVVLLLLYFVNVRPFRFAILYAQWVSMISFMNLCVVGLLMTTFTTRFIFPMISLEGQRLWLLGLLPVSRDTILWSKFLFAAGCLLVPCSILVLISDWMLDVSPWLHLNHQATCVMLGLGLSGLAVGLGARLPSPREQSPSRIAAGFGGTLNLVFGTLYILAIVLLVSLPCHFYLIAQATRRMETIPTSPEIGFWLQFWLIAGAITSLVLAAAATLVPMVIGLRAFRRLEV